MPLTAESISFSYPRGPRVLDAVTCAIEPACVTAIVGPNGAGKSTLVRLLAGLRSPASGGVRLDQQRLDAIPPRQRARRIAFIEQRPSLAFDFSVRRVVSFGVYAAERDESCVAEALRRFQLQEHAAVPFASLSVGQQQRASFARAWAQIARRPDAYLLADEPCSAMDPRHTLETMGAMRELADDGVGVGVVVHDLNIAARFADRAIVLSASGNIVRQGPTHEALDPQTLASVFQVPIERIEIHGRPPLLVVGDL